MSKSHPSEDNEEEILESSDNLSKGGFFTCDNPYTFSVFTAYLPMQLPFCDKTYVTNTWNFYIPNFTYIINNETNLYA
jgi:hypothetical protein